MILFTTWFGTFLYENEKVVKSNLFPNNANEIAKRLKAVANKEILDEEKTLAEGQDRILVLDERLRILGGELIEEEMPDLSPDEFGFSNDMLHEAMMILAKDKTQEPVSVNESVSQAVNALDDLMQSANMLSERLHEWYGMHFPEHRKVMKEEEFIELVIQECKKGGLDNEPDLEPISELARTLRDLHERMRVLEDYIKSQMEDNAANLSFLVGPIIGARLISKAGGLKRLATLPSGTIQVLGAEKALFRHLRDGSNPPKHGLIFQHPLIHRAPYWQRGKIARAFASKIAIAAKLDEHSNKALGEDLKNDLLERIEEIKEKYPKPHKKGSKK
ncbi:MAG: ribosomal biogenesis protein [Thermoplasmata archaeon]|nr:MAG: ribosomal biogenesis protein [Thermoplasmata archaeon]